MAHPSTGNSGRDRRRTTVSGPLPQIDHGDTRRTKSTSSKTMKFPWSSPSAPTSPVASPSAQVPALPTRTGSHRRTVSGGIFSKFNFLKDSGDGEDSITVQDDAENKERDPPNPGSAVSRKSIDDDGASPFSHMRSDGSNVAGSKGGKTRKRKGSLRKTALLGGRKLGSEGRERKNSLLLRNVSIEPDSTDNLLTPRASDMQNGREASPPDGNQQQPVNGMQEGQIRRQFSYESAQAMSSSDSGWSNIPAGPAEKLSLLTGNEQLVERRSFQELLSPVDLKSPESQTSYASASTTDDDDLLSFHRPTKSYNLESSIISLQKPLSAASTSYFPSIDSASEVSLSRRRSSKNKSRSSPLSHNITTLPNPFPEPEPHDYTETEYWGWVILFVTWLTFTVGMGSCLEIWSWAWDVGQTPYAPPELEDDPTLPIVGYYPALIVLTGVVAWIWITVAWVGMKYFRHAKIEV